MQEISNLTDNFESLKLAQSKFMESSISLQGIGRIGDDRDIMVPMTSSLYVPGKLIAGSQVLVDVGTNFIVGKSVKDADEIFQRKIQYVKQSSEQILKMINKKKETLGELVSALLVSQAASTVPDDHLYHVSCAGSDGRQSQATTCSL